MSSGLEKLKTEKLPPFSQLETYMILPAEMAVLSTFRCFEELDQEHLSWRQWEMRQTLIREDGGYQTEIVQSDPGDSEGFVETSGLAVKNRYIRRIQEILQKNSLFLSGVFFPQILWKDIASRLTDSRDEISLLYRENGSYLIVSYRNGKIPVMRWYYGNGKDNDPNDRNTRLREICREFSDIGGASPEKGTCPLYLFRDSFEEDEIQIVEEAVGSDLHEIPLKILPEKGYSPGQIEYLMAYCARKKIAELYIGR